LWYNLFIDKILRRVNMEESDEHIDRAEQLYVIDSLNGKYILAYQIFSIYSAIELLIDPSEKIEELKKQGYCYKGIYEEIRNSGS
jgi:hypothetical protein